MFSKIVAIEPVSLVPEAEQELLLLRAKIGKRRMTEEAGNGRGMML